MFAAMDLIAVAMVVIGLGGLIFFHELGHFIACRLTGTRVEAFAIGFGKELIGWTRGPTRYKICLVPLGGYVKMAAENPGDTNTGAPDEFPNKSFAARVFIMSNGVVFNFLLAFALFVVAFSIGVAFEAPRVGLVAPGSPAWESGLQRGDLVTAAGGKRVLSFNDLQQEIALSAGAPVELTVERGGKTQRITVRPRFDDGVGMPTIGVLPAPKRAVHEVVPGSPVARAGGREGDVVLEIAGLPVDDPEDYRQALVRQVIAAGPGVKEITVPIRVRRAEGTEETLSVVVPLDGPPHVGIAQAEGRVAREVHQGLPGVRNGDVLVAFDGEAIEDIRRELAAMPPVECERDFDNEPEPFI
jgi:regulator of sigma E protease